MVKEMERQNRAVFLDRDGTINMEREYLHRAEDFEFIPGAPMAIKLLKEAGFRVIVVTNQSGIGRGYYDEAAVRNLHRHVDAELARSGTGIDAYYFCPHHPEHANDPYKKECDCRKPMAGMFLQAAADFSLDLSASFMIGDKLADIEAGLAAGCHPLLVKTGYGAIEARRLPRGIPVYDNILVAVRAIINDGDRKTELSE
jgi:D-glycero-D-manno-heptose 1,7-bisphosphate phosphatase